MEEVNNMGFALAASVAVDKCLYPFDRLFDYYVPQDMENDIRVGQTVMVPFGAGNKKKVGTVFELKKVAFDQVAKLKPVLSIGANSAVMNEEQLYLAKWLKENTFCTYYDAIRTILPPGLTFSVSSEYSLLKGDSARLNDEEKGLLADLKKCRTEKELESLISSISDKKLLNALEAKGFLQENHLMKRHIGDETQIMVRLRDNFEQNDRMVKLTAKQRSIVNTLVDYQAASVKEICYICGVTSVVVRNLVKYGILEEYTLTVSRAESGNAEAVKSPEDIVLSEEQQGAFDSLSALMKGKEPKCALLYGVTGSGKTSVFIKLIDKAIREGRTALMLVPEISLTPQTVRNFQSIFGNTVAIIHSNLSMGQRADEYGRIEKGEAKIVIGTRSAVFAPLSNIGIIVIDEEGEHTYKSDRSPRYHARNVAKQRAFRHNSLLLLASATPSPDSRYNAEIGKYSLVTLRERYNKCALPEVYTVDMKAEYESGNRGNFSHALLHEIEENLNRGEQTLLLLNRRGYHTFISCIKCGETMKCPNCDLPLTYHKFNETLCCHYCGYTAPMPDKCPKCGSKYITQSGTGTQRIEDEINAYFPNARILRMDADTTMTKNAFENRFAAFGNGDFDIMVGTQMIAKGLDFENVTLVGVLSVDKSLYSGDYLGYERTFSLITQVVGRSGRGRKKGRAYLQTFSPDHYVLQLAARQDYDEFYRQEIEVRKALLFPPFCDICLIGFSSLMDSPCLNAARRFSEIFRELLKQEEKTMPIRILGPTKMGTGRLGGRFRNKLIIKCKFNRQFRALMNKVIMQAYKDKAFDNVSFFVDINGEIM